MESKNKPFSRQSSEEEEMESSATDNPTSVSEEQVKSKSTDSSSSSVSPVDTVSTLLSEEPLGSSAADSGYRDSSFSVSTDTTVIPVTTRNTAGNSDLGQHSSGGSMGTLSDVGSLSSEAADFLSPSVENPHEGLAAANHPLGRTLSDYRKTSKETEQKSPLKRAKSCEDTVKKCTEKEQVPESVDSDSSDEDLPSVSQYEPMEEEDSGESGRTVSEESGASDNNPSVSGYKKLEESESDASETVRK